MGIVSRTKFLYTNNMVPSKHNTKVLPTWLLCYCGMIGITMVAGMNTEVPIQVETKDACLQSDLKPAMPDNDLMKLKISHRNYTTALEELRKVPGICEDAKKCQDAVLPAERCLNCLVLTTATDTLGKVAEFGNLKLFNVRGMTRFHLQLLRSMKSPDGLANEAIIYVITQAEAAAKEALDTNYVWPKCTCVPKCPDYDAKAAYRMILKT